MVTFGQRSPNNSGLVAFSHCPLIMIDVNWVTVALRQRLNWF